MFGKPVAGQQTRLAEADWPELLGERREGRRVDWLGPTAGHTPAREIHALDIAILDAPHAEVVREIRREADRCPIPRDCAQPFRRTLHECLRRQQEDRPRAIDRTERHPDQSHVVVERQPADCRVLCRQRQTTGAVDGVDVRRKVAMRQRDAFGRRGRPRRELYEGEIVERRRVVGFSRRRVQLFARKDEAKVGAHRTHLFEPGHEPVARHDRARAGGSKNASRELEIPRQIARRGRRVERRRHNAGDRRAQQRRQELFRAVDDDGHEIAAPEPRFAKRARDAERRLADLGIGPAGLDATGDKHVARLGACRLGKRFG